VKKIKKSNDQYELQAVLRGEKFDKNKHEIGIEVKAITYSYMTIEEDKENVKINIVFDI
jgi:SHS2 domain-containing protein